MSSQIVETEHGWDAARTHIEDRVGDENYDAVSYTLWVGDIPVRIKKRDDSNWEGRYTYPFPYGDPETKFPNWYALHDSKSTVAVRARESIREWGFFKPDVYEHRKVRELIREGTEA